MINEKINNLVVVSDTHCGCKLGLCPPEPQQLDDGGTYCSSELQKVVWSWWQEFWNEWVPKATRHEPYAVCMNGDAMDGTHHNSVTQISHNLIDQKRIAFNILKPIVDKCKGRYYHIRGTEAHVGQSGQNEEALAEELGAIPDKNGKFARWDLWINVGGIGLVNILHHIGVTGSLAYETTALMKEYTEACSDAGRWGKEAPQIVIRSHRHRQAEIRVPISKGYGICAVTPAWQLKTPYVWRMAGARLTTPQVGGTLIRAGDEELYTRHFVKSLSRTETVEI